MSNENQEKPVKRKSYGHIAVSIELKEKFDSLRQGRETQEDLLSKMIMVYEKSLFADSS